VEYAIARVDERHGRVNRSIHILSASSAARVLYHDGYASTALGTPKNERALLRIAVDWCSQPNRASADIERIMSEINFTGLPPYTLLFMDRNLHLSGGLHKVFQRSQSGVEGMLTLGLAQQRALADPDNEESDAEVTLLATAAAVDASEYDTTTARPPRFGEELGPGFPSAAELVRIASESAKMKQDALDDVARFLKLWREERVLRNDAVDELARLRKELREELVAQPLTRLLDVVSEQPRGRYCLLSSAWRMLAGLGLSSH